MTVALRGLNDDRDIVTKSCKDHDQPRFAKLMEEKQEASADRASPARTGEIRDGSIDFRRYALEQLNELRYTLDEKAFPRNYANLLSYIGLTPPWRTTAPAMPRYVRN